MEHSAGSSPHARGAPVVRVAVAAPRGIIPACAGSTEKESQTFFAARDHPRMRGEHSILPASLPEVPQHFIHFLRLMRGYHAHR